MLPSQKHFGFAAGFVGIGLVRDVVLLKNAPRSMTGNLHDHRFWNAGPTQIPDCSSAQIMEKQIWHPSPLAR
jgi:hypothetical protein